MSAMPSHMGSAPPANNPEAAARTVYVGGIPQGVDEHTLNALFVHCGQVTQIRLAGKADGYSARFAFVEFAYPQQAQTAVMLNGITLQDRQLKVSMAKSSINTPTLSFIGGAPSRPPRAQGGAQGGYGAPGAGAYGVAPGAAPRAPRPAADPARAARTVHVTNIDQGITEAHLVQYFSACGAVEAVRTSPASSPPPRFAWVEFDSPAAAASALGLTGQQLGTQILKVQMSRSSINHASWKASDQPGYEERKQAQERAREEETARVAAAAATAAAAIAADPADAAAAAGGASAPAESSAHVYNVDAAVGEAEVRAFFADRVGAVVACELLEPLEGKDTREAIVAFETPDVVQSAMGLSGMELGNAAVSVGPALRAPRAAAGAAGAAERGLKRAADADASEEASADKRARED